MAIYQCKACGGVYQSPQRDGSSYFHACAPIHNPDYDAQFVIGDDGNVVPKGPLDPNIPQVLDRPDKRDENIQVKPDGKVGRKTEGEGKELLP